MKSQTLTVDIDAPAGRVYAFACREENLPRWVPSFFLRVWRDGATWRAETPLGPASVAFAPANAHGVLDHRIVLESGGEFFNPMRVISCGEGSVLIFTLFQGEGISDDDFARDAELVRADFARLAALMAQEPGQDPTLAATA